MSDGDLYCTTLNANKWLDSEVCNASYLRQRLDIVPFHNHC
jgi:hypothetical protein